MHPTPLPESGTNGTGTEVTHDPLIRAGFCYALFAYDVGLGIDLDAASLLVRELTQRDAVRHQRPTPRYFNFTHPRCARFSRAIRLRSDRWPRDRASKWHSSTSAPSL
jgi:hypothetical protein